MASIWRGRTASARPRWWRPRPSSGRGAGFLRGRYRLAASGEIRLAPARRGRGNRRVRCPLRRDRSPEYQRALRWGHALGRWRRAVGQRTGLGCGVAGRRPARTVRRAAPKSAPVLGRLLRPHPRGHPLRRARRGRGAGVGGRRAGPGGSPRAGAGQRARLGWLVGAGAANSSRKDSRQARGLSISSETGSPFRPSSRSK